MFLLSRSVLLHAVSPFFPQGLFFLVVPLVVGFLPAVLTFALRPNAAETIGLTQVPLPAWFFVGVWLIIYPSLGVSAWVVWQTTSPQNQSIAFALLAATVLQSTSFWWTDHLRTTAVIDATGILFATLSLFVIVQYSPGAAWWILPLLIWMPITLGIKLVALRQVGSPSPRHLA